MNLAHYNDLLKSISKFNNIASAKKLPPLRLLVIGDKFHILIESLVSPDAFTSICDGDYLRVSKFILDRSFYYSKEQI